MGGQELIRTFGSPSARIAVLGEPWLTRTAPDRRKPGYERTCRPRSPLPRRQRSSRSGSSTASASGSAAG